MDLLGEAPQIEKIRLFLDGDGHLACTCDRIQSGLMKRLGLYFSWKETPKVWRFATPWQAVALWRYADPATRQALSAALPGLRPPPETAAVSPPLLIADFGERRLLLVGDPERLSELARGSEVEASGCQRVISDIGVAVALRDQSPDLGLRALLRALDRRLMDGETFDPGLLARLLGAEAQAVGAGSALIAEEAGDQKKPVLAWNEDYRAFHLRGEPAAGDGWIRARLPSGKRVQLTTSLRAAESVRALATGDAEWHFREKWLGHEILLKDPAPLPMLPDHLAEFQRQGVAYLWARRGAVLGDDMGIGKTVQAMAFAEALTRITSAPILISAPAALLPNWEDEAVKWLPPGMLARISRKCPAGAFGLPGYPSLMLVPHEGLHKPEIQKVRFAAAIFDESHAFGNPASRRGRAMLSIQAERHVFMTGTPIPNRPGGLFPLLHAIAPRAFPDGARFRRDFGASDVIEAAQTPWRQENYARLGGLLRNTLMLRRLKSEVLPQLPAKHRRVIRVDVATTAQQRESQSLWGELAAADGVAQGDLLRRLTILTRSIGREKIASVSEILLELAASERPFVVFTAFRDIAEDYVARLTAEGVPVLLAHGGISPEERQKRCRAFQAGEALGFIGTLASIGTGLTLTRAQVAIFAELHWSAVLLRQGEDRINRLGSTHDADILYVCANGTIDEHIAATAEAKDAVAALAQGDCQRVNEIARLLADLERLEAENGSTPVDLVMPLDGISGEGISGGDISKGEEPMARPSLLAAPRSFDEAKGDADEDNGLEGDFIPFG